MTHGAESTNTCDGANSIDTAIGELGLDESGDLKAFVTTVQDAFSDMGKRLIPPDKGNVEEVALREALEERYLAYALSTIMNRALPDARDGLKPVLQPGNCVSATWRARLDEHLGNYSVEALNLRAAGFFSVPHAGAKR